MKKIYFSLAVGIPILLSGCGSKPVELPVSADSTFSLGQTYTIGSQDSLQQTVYGIVVGDNLKNIFSNAGGILTSIDCQPGEKVSADTLIARIVPNEDDPGTQNLRLQQSSLQAQLDNLQATYDMTEQNFDVQKETLLAQTDNNQELYGQDNADIKKIQDSIQNFKDQQENAIMDAFKKVRDSGGNARYLSIYEHLYGQRDEIQNLSDTSFSQYLEDMANLMERTSKYASGDALYSMFMGLSNGFRTSKSAFDTLIDSYKSAQNAYTNQHNTLGLTIDLADQQVQAIENSKQIQLNGLQNQMQTLQQTLDSLSNTLEAEDLYAGVDGVVKAKAVGANNKVNPNTMICQIVPADSTSKKIQIFSANRMAIGQIVKLFNGDTLLGAAKLQYELPYKDSVTQNYIYEIVDTNLPLKEGDRLNVQFFKKLNAAEVWIPVSFIFSKLDGNYVRIQSGSGFVEMKVDLGDINGTLVRVMSGASMGQTIVN